jgi:hypothetical protein
MDGVTINEVPAEAPNPLKVPEPKLEEKKELTPEEKMVESLKAYAEFLHFENGILSVKHDEYVALLKPKILKMGDLVKRGNIITNLNNGITAVDGQSATMNSCIATVQVGFDNLSLDLLNVVDSDLILGLYRAVVEYNTFFRKTPLRFIL